MASNASLGTAKLIAELDATGFRAGLKRIETETKRAFSQVVQEADRVSESNMGEALSSGMNEATAATAEYRAELQRQESELQSIIEAQDAASKEYAEATDRLRDLKKELANVNAGLAKGAGSGELKKSFAEVRVEAEQLSKVRFGETLRAEVTAGIRPLGEYRKHLQGQIRELEGVVKAQNRASEEYERSVARLAELKTELRSVNQELKTSETMFNKIGKTSLIAGGALTAGVTLPLGAIGATGLKSAMQLETFAASLNVLIGDAERAALVFDELYEFSSETPFDWRTLSESTRILAAFGTEAENVVPTLSMLGDIAAGTGSELTSLAEIYGRVQITGRLSMEEVNRLAERGVPIYTALAEQLGVTEQGVRELVSAGGIGFRELEQSFINMTSEGGKFFNMMVEMSKTTEGRLARLKDTFEQVTDAVGDRLLPIFGRLIDTGQVMVDWFVDLDESTQGLIISLGGIAAALGPVLLGVSAVAFALPNMIAGFTAMAPILLPLLGGAGILAGLAAGFFYLNDAMNEGHRERKRVSDDYQEMVRSMGAYRTELKITGEAERQELIASLERRKEALQRVLQMHQTMIRQMEAEVIAFANMPLWKQIFNVGSTNVTLDALENADREARAVQQELDDIDTQIGEVRTMEITVDVDDPSGVLTGKGDKAEDPIVARAQAISQDLQRLKLLRDSGRMDAESYEGWVQAHLRDLQRLWGESTNLEQKRAVLQAESGFLTELRQLESEREQILEEGLSQREQLRQQELDNAISGYENMSRIAQMEAQILMSTGEWDDDDYLRFLKKREAEALQIYGESSSQYLQARLAVLNQEQRIEDERVRNAATAASMIEREMERERQTALALARNTEQAAQLELRLGRELNRLDPDRGIDDDEYLEILQARYSTAKAMYGENSEQAMAAELEVLKFQEQLNRQYEANMAARNATIEGMMADQRRQAQEEARRLEESTALELSIRLALPEDEGGITAEQNIERLRQRLATTAEVHGEWSVQWMRDYLELSAAEAAFNAEKERLAADREAMIRREMELEEQRARDLHRNTIALRDMEIRLRRERGEISDEDYLAMLQTRLEQARSQYGEFSRQAMAIELELLAVSKQVDDEAAASAKRRADAIEAEFERERRAAQAIADANKRRAAAELEVGRATGSITDDDYEVILQRRLDIFPEFSEDWMAAWREMNALQEKRNEEAQRIIDQEKQAADTFANAVVASAFSFANALVSSIESGDVGSAISAAFQAGSSILQASDLGALDFLGGSIPIGTIAGAAVGLLGGIFGSIFGGQQRQEEERRRREQAQSRSVPAININFNVQQTNNYQGGPRDPANEQALSRNADTLFESFYTRVLDPRFKKLERAAGVIS